MPQITISEFRNPPDHALGLAATPITTYVISSLTGTTTPTAQALTNEARYVRICAVDRAIKVRIATGTPTASQSNAEGWPAGWTEFREVSDNTYTVSIILSA